MPPRSAPLPGPAPVTKNVMSGAWGNCGAAGCCCALDPDVTPSASAAMISTFDLLIPVSPLEFIDTAAEFAPCAPSKYRNKRRTHLSHQGAKEVIGRGAPLTDDGIIR